MRLRNFLLAAFLASASCLLAAASSGSPAHGSPTARYKIYCAEEVVEVSTLAEEQIREQRKGAVCRLLPDEFENLSDAREAAKRFGGIGAPCSCQK